MNHNDERERNEKALREVLADLALIEGRIVKLLNSGCYCAQSGDEQISKTYETIDSDTRIIRMFLDALLSGPMDTAESAARLAKRDWQKQLVMRESNA